MKSHFSNLFADVVVGSMGEIFSAQDIFWRKLNVGTCDGGSKMQKLDFDRCRRREDFQLHTLLQKASASDGSGITRN